MDTDAVKEMMREFLKDDEMFKLQAELTKKKFDALVAEGFSDDHAVLIVANQTSGA